MRHSKRALGVLALLFVPMSAGSCVAHEHMIGLGPTGLGETSTRQFYVLFGLVAFNEVNVQRSASDLTSYAVVTEYSFVDLLLAPLLLPLTATSRTVTVRT